MSYTSLSSIRRGTNSVRVTTWASPSWLCQDKPNSNLRNNSIKAANGAQPCSRACESVTKIAKQPQKSKRMLYDILKLYWWGLATSRSKWAKYKNLPSQWQKKNKWISKSSRMIKNKSLTISLRCRMKKHLSMPMENDWCYKASRRHHKKLSIQAGVN